MKTLYIIGNGFDMHHDIKCSYKNFREWLGEHHSDVPNKIEEIYGQDVANKVIIQYGGSVKSSNAKELFEMTDIDGGLVGGASLKAEEFSKIVEFRK